MILRKWHGLVPAERAAEYVAYQRDVAPPGFRKVTGNRGFFFYGRERGERYEFAVISLWDDWDAVRRFAGDDVERAYYYDRDPDFLIDPPERVEHYEVLEAEGLADAPR